MTSRRDFIRHSGLGSLGALLTECGNGSQSKGKPERPNIVLIMADDMGYSDIGCYGGDIDTPNLDRLAANGLCFSSFYNNAVCCPTRASLMTGRYQHQVDMGCMTYDTGITGYRGDLGKNCVTIAEVLKQVGYRTCMSGKWHLTTHYGHWIDDEEHMSKHNWPLQRGFDSFYGIIDGTSNYFQPFSLVRDNDPVPLDSDRGYYLTDAVTDHAVECIEQTPTGTPFFSYMAYTAPHWPLHAFPEDTEKYRGRFDEGWDILRERRFRRMVDMGVIDPSWGMSERDPGTGPFEEEEHRKWRIRCMEVYAAMIDRMDSNIGRIIETLENTGRLDNTVVMFLSDNGGQANDLNRGIGIKRYTPLTARDGRPMRPGNDPSVMPGPEDSYQSYGTGWANLSNTPFLKFKTWVYEGGISAPFIVHWLAGIKARGEFRRQVAHVTDIMPSCCELAGADYPHNHDGTVIEPPEGISLLRVFGNETLERGALFWEFAGHRAVRKGRWKLIAPPDGGWELYDIDADRCEKDNLAAQFPDKLQELETIYTAWAERCGVRAWDELNEAHRNAAKHVDIKTAEYRKRNPQ